MRKIVSCSLIMIMCFAFSACSDTGSEQKQDASSSSDGYEFHGLSNEQEDSAFCAVCERRRKYGSYQADDNSSDESEQ